MPLFNRPYPNLSQSVGLLLTVIIVLMAIGLPVVLITHSLEMDLSAHPLVLGVTNLLAIGYVIRQSVAQQGGTLLESARLIPVDARLAIPMLATLAGAAILISELDNLVVSLYPVPEEWAAPLAELATGQHGWFATIFLLNIVAPVTEELLFRGVILHGFLQIYPTRKAVLLSAFLFAVFHLNPWQGIGAFMMGALFGWWFVRTRSLLPCLLGHALFNAIPVIVYGIMGFAHPDVTGPPEFQPLWLDAAGLLLLGGGGFVLHRTFQTTIPVPRVAWLAHIVSFADNLLDHARDDYGSSTSPIFVSQIDARNGELPPSNSTLYATASRGGAGPTSNNLHFDGGLLRLLYGLSDYTGDSAYASAGNDYLSHYLGRLPLPSGYFPWGDHRGYDVVEDDVIDGYGEFKVSLPVWDRMWAVDPEAVIRQADALRNHIIDPARSLAFDRHYPPENLPHCASSSAGAWIVLWTFVYTQTDDRQYLDWAVEMADYMWSLRNPDTDFLAALPFDPAYPEMRNDVSARRRASRTENLGPMYGYAANLLRAHKLVSPEQTPFRSQALTYINAFASRFDTDPNGHFFATFDLESGAPLFDRISEGWQATSQAEPDETSSSVVGLRAPISLAHAHAFTREPAFREAFDRLQPLFEMGRFADLNAPPMPISAGLLAQAIGAWTNLYVTTMEYGYLGGAVTLGRYALHHYRLNNWFVCGPPTAPRYRDNKVTGWETYSNRGGSADLALALLRLTAISDGRFDLVEDDAMCYF